MVDVYQRVSRKYRHYRGYGRGEALTLFLYASLGCFVMVAKDSSIPSTAQSDKHTHNLQRKSAHDYKMSADTFTHGEESRSRPERTR